MRWNPFTHSGQEYDLSHLHPFSMEVLQPAQGDKPERIYGVDVIFSLHCFTRSVQEGDDETLAYSDNRETRTFCFDRYKYTQYLPAVIRKINERTCYQTGKGNFLTIEILTDENEQVEYEIYFEASKSGKKPARVNLYVQSAYVRDQGREYRKTRRKIRFSIIAYNVLHNKPIKPARN